MCTNCGCTVSSLKWLLNVYNIIFLITGVAVSLLGVRELRSLQFSTQIHTISAYLLLLSAILILVVNLIGCIAIIRLNRKLLFAYGFMLIIILFLELACGVLMFFTRAYVKQEISERFRDAFMVEYGTNQYLSTRVDNIQTRFKCCGIKDFTDWEQSSWRAKLSKSFINKVPTSCCISVSSSCARWKHPSNIYYEGCAEVISEMLQNHLSYISGLGLGILCLQILFIFLVFLLYSKLRYFEIANYSVESMGGKIIKSSEINDKKMIEPNGNQYGFYTLK